jgi:uncharacterized protein YacL
MSNQNKEKILVQLRAYHALDLPKVSNNKKIQDLIEEITVIEDQITSMVLQLINGKSLFVESNYELEILQKKVSKLPQDIEQAPYKKILLTKIDLLLNLLIAAKESMFKLRVPRTGAAAK